MEKGIINYTDTNIFIISSLSLQSEFLLYVIKKEISANCTIFDRDLNAFSENPILNEIEDNNKPLILIGC